MEERVQAADVKTVNYELFLSFFLSFIYIAHLYTT